MYAVIASGGKQYKVRPGDIVSLEKLATETGKPVTFDQVLWVSDGNEQGSKITLGKPTIKGASVAGEVVAQGRADKLISFKMKRRKQFRRKKGHRQERTEVLILGIDAGAAKASLSASDKKNILDKFITQLTPRGEGYTPKTLGSRIRMKQKERVGRKERSQSNAAKKAAPKKTTKKQAAAAKTRKKSAAKKKAAKKTTAIKA